MQWAGADLPNIASIWDLEISPLEQVADLLERFCSGEELVIGHAVKHLHPARDAVWELKTPDTRIFGWFHAPDCFVAAVGDSAERVKKHDLYRGYVGEVVRFRDALDLDEPKFLVGTDPYAVVSNYRYPAP